MRDKVFMAAVLHQMETSKCAVNHFIHTVMQPAYRTVLDTVGDLGILAKCVHKDMLLCAGVCVCVFWVEG